MPEAIDGVAVKVPDGQRFVEVRRQLSKISEEVKRNTASWKAILDNGGALPAGADLDTVYRATLDAIGTLHTSTEELQKQVEETKRNSLERYREQNVAPIKRRLAKREASLAAALMRGEPVTLARGTVIRLTRTLRICEKADEWDRRDYHCECRRLRPRREGESAGGACAAGGRREG